MIKISIVTVNLNNLNGLKKTLESVARQTFQDFEYIIIDGASTDGSAELIQDHKHEIDNFISEPDSGVYDAMNKGIALSSGEYLLFLNSGDYFFSKNSLQNAINHIQDYDLIYFNQQVKGETKEFKKTYPDKLSFSYFLIDNIPQQATFIKRQALIRYGNFNTELRIISDWVFFMDWVCILNGTYQHINQTLSVFELGGISSNAKAPIKIKEEKNRVLACRIGSFEIHNQTTLENQRVLRSLRRSRIIKLLIKLKLLNRF